MHYSPGQEYQHHCDYYPLGQDVGPAGNRVAACFVYLSDAVSGGETHFPLAELRVSPAAGSALVWAQVDKHCMLDGRTLHAGCPVHAGEKWGMNIWLRQRPHRPPGDPVHIDAVVKEQGGQPTAPPQTAVPRAAKEATILRERHC